MAFLFAMWEAKSFKDDNGFIYDFKFRAGIAGTHLFIETMLASIGVVSIIWVNSVLNALIYLINILSMNELLC